LTHVTPQMIRYDQEFVLRDFAGKFKNIDNSIGTTLTMIKKSKLVIVEYLSTAYIESLMADVPTVFFWNKEIYYLNEEYKDIYSSLEKVGICQTDPIEAAEFIDNIKDAPEMWWFSKSVQDAKNEFLGSNFGSPEILKRYIINLQFEGGYEAV